MTAKSALMAAAIILAPAIAAAAQPAQTPPDQGAAKTHDPATRDNAAGDASKSAAKTDPACNAVKAKDKSADAGAKASSSAKVGKDTGVIPTGRIKKSSDTACATQPQ